MKIQISRLSPHQNAKVLSVLMAVGSLIFVVPMFLLFSLMPVPEGQQRPPAIILLFFPIIYLVMGYVMISIGCALYNIVTRYVGGIEYEV
jgi:hypothetical protein